MALLVEKKARIENDSETEYLIINSIEDTDSTYDIDIDGSVLAIFSNQEVINELLKYTPRDLGKFFNTIFYTKKFDHSYLYIKSVDIAFNCKLVNLTLPRIDALFRIDLLKWNKPYSILDFVNEMSLIIETDENYSYIINDNSAEIYENFGFNITYIDDNCTFFDIDKNLTLYIENLIDRTETSLISKLDANILVTYFKFPEPTKTACKQYLIYFSQFLLDIGIIADTEVKELANQTLFSVIPRDANNSLVLIRDALSVYLDLPKTENLKILQVGSNKDISVIQLQSNIMHLTSQLLIANSVIQLKDATIEQLQLSNYQYKSSLPVSEVKKNNDKEEEIIEGIISIKKYEGKGFTINLPEILRRMKRGFKSS